MNAPESRMPFAEPTVELVPMDSLWPSSTHVQQLRRKRFNDAALTDLAASLLKSGQMQPILVRPRPPVMIEGRKYEIVLGERRYLAAGRAGFKHIQATIRELDDAEVLEAQLIENLQREDLHPLEEAEGYRELMAASGVTKEALGERLGKSRSWVYARLALLKIPEAARSALEEGKIDISRAEVIAAIGDPNHQAEALKMALEPMWSVRELKARFRSQGFTVSLRKAPFDLVDAQLLPERGSCGGCEFRSANHEAEAEDPDVCTNRSCYEKKVKAHGARTLKEAEADGRAVLRGDAAKKVSLGRDRYDGYVDLDTACDFDEFPEVEPKVPADTEEYDDPAWSAWDERREAWQPRTYRELLAAGGHKLDTVLLEGKGKRAIELAPFKELKALLKKSKIDLPAHIARKDPPRAPAYDWKAEEAKREKERKEREAAEAKEREAAEAKERAWRIAVFKAIVAKKPKPKLTTDELVAVVEAFLDDHTISHGMRLAGLTWPKIGTLKEDQLYRVLRLGIAAIDISQIGQPGKAEDLVALAKACKVDVAKIKKEVAAQAAPAESSKKTQRS